MKDNQKKNNPAGNKGQGDADTRNKKQTPNNPASRDAHQKDEQERRSTDKIARKGTDTTSKNPGLGENNPSVNETENKTVDQAENKTTKPWKDPDPTKEKNKEVYAEPGTTEGDDTTINPKTENKQRNTNTQNTGNEEVIEEERQRGTNKSGDANKMEEGDEEQSDPGTFDPQAGNDTEAFKQNKQNKNTGESNTTDKSF